MIYRPKTRPKRSADTAWERHLDRWRAGEIELTEEESERFNTEHADMTLIARYFGGDLSPDECARVEERAETDAEFRLDLHIVNAVDGRLRAGLHDETLFGLEETAHARRNGNRLLGASIVFIGSVLALAVAARVRQAGTWLDDRIAERAITSDLKQPQKVEALWGDKLLGFEYADIDLRGGSRVTFAKDFRSTGGGGLIALDGEAAFHPWATGITVRTSNVAVHTIAGRYAVRSIVHSGVTLVTVDSGQAWIEVLGTETLLPKQHRVLTLMRPGERASVTRDGVVRFVSSPGDFPVSAFDPPWGSQSRSTRVEQLRGRRLYENLKSRVMDAHVVP